MPVVEPRLWERGWVRLVHDRRVVGAGPDADHAARIVAADNRTADLGGYDERLLAELLGDLPDLAGTGYTEDDLHRLVSDLADDTTATGDDAPRPSLADRFLVPHFSVLDARLGWWQDRKRAVDRDRVARRA